MRTSPFDQLDREWRNHHDNLDSQRAFEALRTRIPAIATIGDADTLVRLARRGHGADRIDRILADLTAAAIDGDQHAARIVLQALIPGLKLIALRLHWTADADTVESTVITTAWDRICSYPIRNRPQRIAANIIRDTQSRVRRELQHPREVGADDATFDGQAIELDYSSIEAADHIRRHLQRGKITRRAAQIIVATRLHHQSFDDIADATGDTKHGLRRQRARAESRLRRALA